MRAIVYYNCLVKNLEKNKIIRQWFRWRNIKCVLSLTAEIVENNLTGASKPICSLFHHGWRRRSFVLVWVHCFHSLRLRHVKILLKWCSNILSWVVLRQSKQVSSSRSLRIILILIIMILCCFTLCIWLKPMVRGCSLRCV